MFKGSLGKDKIAAFMKPLSAITSFISDEHGGIVLNVNKEKKEANVRIVKNNTLLFVDYTKEIFGNFDITQDEKIGILKVPDFIKYFSVINDEKVDLRYEDSSKELFISSDNSEISFRTADTDIIKEGPSKFGGSSWVTGDIIIDAKLDKLQKAMSVLAAEECVFIKGSAADSSLSFTVKNSGVALNKFSLKISASVNTDFDAVYNKELLQLAFSLPATEKKFIISSRMMMIEGKTPDYTLTYFIARNTKKD